MTLLRFVRISEAKLVKPLQICSVTSTTRSHSSGKAGVYTGLVVKAYCFENLASNRKQFKFAALSDWKTACLDAHKLRRCAKRNAGIHGGAEVVTHCAARLA